MAAALVLLLVLLLLLGAGGARGGLWGFGGARGAPWGGALHLLHPQGALHLGRLARGRGPVLHVRGGGRDVLVLSSVGTIREALARNWGVWMGRPPSYLGSLVSRGGQDLALGGGSPGWRSQRAAARGALGRAGGRLRPLLSHQAALLCEELRSHGGAPLDPFEIFAFHTCSTIGRLLFGDLVLPNPGLRELLRLVEKRDAFVEAQIRRHQEHPSPPADTVLGALWGGDPGVRGGPLGPARLHMTLVDLFIGGTETTAAALGWAVAFLLHRPELQPQLRSELTVALGPTGTPAPGDASRLPLLQAVVTETLRLRPPAPLGLPHRAARHTSVAGVPVPAGSILVPNLLAAQTDPDTWHDPEAFLPERFLAPGAPVRALLPFGCGARACPGEGVARAELFVFLGHILRDFRLEPPAPGELPGLGVRGGTVLRCPPFRVRLTPVGPP
ncbi:steroid 21-hydroxylase isoform X2 [Patagioenas fasciata]|uniref:steroid 21-hydroxylase isoform X2 n=1 Tax=Patagioenas fasciata TaxID=372321 RepID=UPI003A98DB5E